MKTNIHSRNQWSIFIKLLLLAALAFSLAAQPTHAAPATIVGGHITTDTVWAAAGSPYQVDSFLYVDAGVTLTIQAGVTVENYGGGGSTNYEFTVEGTLVANGGIEAPIYFYGGSDGWSGINIIGAPGDIHYGSVLHYVILDGGGFGGSGVGANLRIQYAEVIVQNCLFTNSPGDGILGDDAGGQGSANINTSVFTNNAGYAVNFEDGSVNPVLAWLTATGNGPTLPYGGNLVVINDATLHGTHNWEYMGLPYLILQTIVAPDAILTIEPGVQVLAQPGNDALDVEGMLRADAAAGNEIHFDPADSTLGWSGISFKGTKIQPTSGNLLNHVSVNKAGSTGNCDLYVTYAEISVMNSHLDGGMSDGVCLDHGASLTMTDTQITNNQGYAMDVIDANARFTLDNLGATGNTSNSIGVEGGTITGIHTWPKSGINTYDRFYGDVTIAPTGTLNIDPGVTVLFGVTRDITVHGTLTAIGTPSEPILFTGETPTPGLWAGLTFEGTTLQHAVGKLAYTTLEYGGYGGSAMVSIQNADLTFTHCILRYCTSDAIRILPDTGLVAQFASPLAAPPVKINWSSLVNISGYAINNGSSQVAQAAYNWWGAASGPTADDNPGGTGSGLNGLVDYRPYLISLNSSYLFIPFVMR